MFLLFFLILCRIRKHKLLLLYEKDSLFGLEAYFQEDHIGGELSIKSAMTVV